MQWGRSNLVDPAGWTKIGLLSCGVGSSLLILPRKKQHNTEFTKSSSVWTPEMHRIGFLGIGPDPASSEERLQIRNQEKGVLAKGVSAESRVTPKETKNTRGYWAQQYISHSEHHSQERPTSWHKPLLKTPFSWFLIRVDLSDVACPHTVCSLGSFCSQGLGKLYRWLPA